MIDFDDMQRRQLEGFKQVDSLQGDELAVLQHYCSLATEELVKVTDKSFIPKDQLVINALKYGIAMGLRLQITEGEIQGRP